MLSQQQRRLLPVEDKIQLKHFQKNSIGHVSLGYQTLAEKPNTLRWTPIISTTDQTLATEKQISLDRNTLTSEFKTTSKMGITVTDEESSLLSPRDNMWNQNFYKKHLQMRGCQKLLQRELKDQLQFTTDKGYKLILP